MPWLRKSKQKAQRVVRRKKRDGSVVEYRYAAYKPNEANRDTVSGLVDAYQNSIEWSLLSESTKLHRRGYLRHFAAIGPMPLEKVKRRDIIAIHDSMREIGDGAANGFLASAKALYTWAISKDIVEHSPTMHVRPLKGGHWRPWTGEEADRAEAGLPEPMRRAIVLARHTGQRRADLCSIRWNQYDGAVIRLTQQKTKPGSEPVTLTIPVTGTLKAELDAWKAEAVAVTILENAHGRPWRPESLTQLLPYYLKPLGLDGLGIHGLRKLAAAELANAGCSMHEIAAITGHRTLQMVELYTKSADQVRLADAAVTRLADYQRKRKI